MSTWTSHVTLNDYKILLGNWEFPRHLTAVCFSVALSFTSKDSQFSSFHCLQMAALNLICLSMYRRQHHSAVPTHDPLGFLHCLFWLELYRSLD